MKRKFIFKIIFSFFLFIVTFCAAEIIFRFLIFSKNSPFPDLKDPGKYAKIYSDDYWKLYHEFDGIYKPPAHPHPLLGWGGFFDTTYKHWDINVPTNKRKVLMFGDSFVMCANDSIDCFHELLNADTAFTKENILLNYGVGGYGIDQECLLFEKAIGRYENIFVVFCLTPTDMDRCMLAVRTGQKPYFAKESDSLKLCGMPVDPLPENFFKKNPPQIASYLWRRIVNSDLNPWFTPFMNEEEKKKEMSVCGRIILRAYNEIKKRNLDYLFLVFNELSSEDGLWRTDFLNSFLSENNIAHIDT